MFLHEARRSRSRGWTQPNAISLCGVIYNLNITTAAPARPFNKISQVLCSDRSLFRNRFIYVTYFLVKL